MISMYRFITAIFVILSIFVTITVQYSEDPIPPICRRKRKSHFVKCLEEECPKRTNEVYDPCNANCNDICGYKKGSCSSICSPGCICKTSHCREPNSDICIMDKFDVNAPIFINPYENQPEDFDYYGEKQDEAKPVLTGGEMFIVSSVDAPAPESSSESVLDPEPSSEEPPTQESSAENTSIPEPSSESTSAPEPSSEDPPTYESSTSEAPTQEPNTTIAPTEYRELQTIIPSGILEQAPKSTAKPMFMKNNVIGKFHLWDMGMEVSGPCSNIAK
ncbi:uncharacterized protein LOC123291392 [Chrysoperla carnea]|uniref:uncharacterized protein LOC123291392 n=1 Tax=Chrysoperla carnea TaxID=189513 RepID=UPI001D0782E2|nr:uncharacterized protein LOC123291392 [Chrysoperla carnea]